MIRPLTLRTSNGTFHVVPVAWLESRASDLDAEILPSAVARWAVEDWLVDPVAQRDLGGLVAHALGPSPGPSTIDRLRARAAVLCERIADGSFVVLRARPPTPLRVPRDVPAGPVLGPPPESVETPWFELFVVSHDDESPVAGVTLTIRRPDGKEIECTTDGAGKVAVDPIRSGTCRVSAGIADLSFARTLEVTGTGRAGALPAPSTTRSHGAAPPKLASIERHHVRTGETLKGLAEGAGLTWQQLAKFNFETDAPAKVNDKLRSHVGCTRKAKDRKNYVFSDTDDPGIVYIPHKFVEDAMRTETAHVIRTRPLARPSRIFLFSY